MKVLIEKVPESLLLAGRKRNDTTERRRSAFFQINFEIVQPVLSEHISLYFIKDIGEVLVLGGDVGAQRQSCGLTRGSSCEYLGISGMDEERFGTCFLENAGKAAVPTKAISTPDLVRDAR